MMEWEKNVWRTRSFGAAARDSDTTERNRYVRLEFQHPSQRNQRDIVWQWEWDHTFKWRVVRLIYGWRLIPLSSNPTWNVRSLLIRSNVRRFTSYWDQVPDLFNEIMFVPLFAASTFRIGSYNWAFFLGNLASPKNFFPKSLLLLGEEKIVSPE